MLVTTIVLFSGIVGFWLGVGFAIAWYNILDKEWDHE